MAPPETHPLLCRTALRFGLPPGRISCPPEAAIVGGPGIRAAPAERARLSGQNGRSRSEGYRPKPRGAPCGRRGLWNAARKWVCALVCPRCQCACSPAAPRSQTGQWTAAVPGLAMTLCSVDFNLLHLSGNAWHGKQAHLLSPAQPRLHDGIAGRLASLGSADPIVLRAAAPKTHSRDSLLCLHQDYLHPPAAFTICQQLSAS